MKKLLLIILACLCTGNSFSQSTLSPSQWQALDSLYKIALTQAKGYDLMKQLCAFGPRLSGSENSAKVLNWVVEELSKIPGCTIKKQPVTVPYWERGLPESVEICTGKYKKQLSAAALGGSIATPTQGITAKVIEVSSFDELRAKGKDVVGKIVFFNRHFNKTNLNTFASYGELAGLRVWGAREAAKLGAVGTILRSITSKDDNVPHVGVMIYEETIRKIPSLSLGVQDADYLHAALQKDTTLSLKIKTNCSDITYRQSANIIAEIKGSEVPEQIILMGGHSDSWDKGDGATDDGAGMIHTMESLYLLKQIQFQPRHTLRFVLFINEENGSKGASAYADSSLKNNENHLAAIESDRGGFTPLGFTFDGDSAKIEKIKQFFPNLAHWNLWYFQKGGSGADVGPLKNCAMKFGFIPDSQRYFDLHHSDNDVIGEINPRELELGSAANAAMIYLLDSIF